MQVDISHPNLRDLSFIQWNELAGFLPSYVPLVARYRMNLLGSQAWK